jgi:hypothetical protein
VRQIVADRGDRAYAGVGLLEVPGAHHRSDIALAAAGHAPAVSR